MTETSKKYGRAAEPDHYKMNIVVQGKPHTFHIKRQRFESVVDRIDKDVHRNKSIEEITRKHGEHFAKAPFLAKEPSKTVQKIKNAVAAVNSGPFDKKAHVAAFSNAHPNATVGQIAKLASADGRMTSANARYLAMRLKG